jgi:tetratricopeptide (TPR) repeat protein
MKSKRINQKKIAITVFFISITLVFLPAGEKTKFLPEAGDKSSVGVLSFENKTGDDSLDYIGKNISGLLSTDLNQSRYLKVLSELDPLDTIAYNPQSLDEIASRANCDHLLTGFYTKAGNLFRISATFHNMVSGEQNTHTLSGSEDQIFNMVDNFTRWIKTVLNFSDKQIAKDIDRPIADITTASLVAYNFYYLAKESIIKDKDDQRIQNLEAALEIDPEFASACIELSNIYFDQFRIPEGKKYINIALDLKNRLPERMRLIIEGDDYKHQGYLKKAIESNKELLQLYPGDIDALSSLTNLYQRTGEYEKMFRTQEIILAMNPKNLDPGCAYPYWFLGKYDKAIEVLEWYKENYPPNEWIYNMYAWIYSGQRKFDLALREIDIADSLYSKSFGRWLDRGRINLWAGDFIKAEYAFQKAFEWPDDEAHFYAIWQLWGLYMLQGRINDAINIAKDRIEWAKNAEMEFYEPFLRNLMLKSLGIRGDDNQSPETAGGTKERIIIYLDLGLFEEAQKELDQFNESIKDRSNRNLVQNYYLLQGLINLEKNIFTEAIESFKHALSLAQPNPNIWVFDPLRHAIIYDHLARAYYRAGDVDKAVEEYKNLLNLIVLKHWYGYVITKGNYELAKIYQERGEQGKAIEYYEKFLHIWKEADEDLPELIDAKKRLANLKSK